MYVDMTHVLLTSNTGTGLEGVPMVGYRTIDLLDGDLYAGISYGIYVWVRETPPPIGTPRTSSGGV